MQSCNLSAMICYSKQLIFFNAENRNIEFFCGDSVILLGISDDYKAQKSSIYLISIYHIHPSIHLSIYPSIYTALYLSIHLSIYPSMHPS